MKEGQHNLVQGHTTRQSRAFQVVGRLLWCPSIIINFKFYFKITLSLIFILSLKCINTKALKENCLLNTGSLSRHKNLVLAFSCSLLCHLLQSTLRGLVKLQKLRYLAVITFSYVILFIFLTALLFLIIITTWSVDYLIVVCNLCIGSSRR